jgi:hypothetical protein
MRRCFEALRPADPSIAMGAVADGCSSFGLLVRDIAGTAGNLAMKSRFANLKPKHLIGYFMAGRLSYTGSALWKLSEGRFHLAPHRPWSFGDDHQSGIPRVRKGPLAQLGPRLAKPLLSALVFVPDASVDPACELAVDFVALLVPEPQLQGYPGLILVSGGNRAPPGRNDQAFPLARRKGKSRPTSQSLSKTGGYSGKSWIRFSKD